MILLVDLCFRNNSLGYEEYVLPLARIAEKEGYLTRAIHFRSVSAADISRADAVILCGTPLADNTFLEEPGSFSWLLEAGIPVLGICAGMEIISLLFGGALGRCTEIGMSEVRMMKEVHPFEGISSFPAYEVHTMGCRDPGMLEVVAGSERCIQIVKLPNRPVFGVMFHPEVRNEWVVERFLTLVR